MSAKPDFAGVKSLLFSRKFWLILAGCTYTALTQLTGGITRIEAARLIGLQVCILVIAIAHEGKSTLPPGEPLHAPTQSPSSTDNGVPHDG